MDQLGCEFQNQAGQLDQLKIDLNMANDKFNQSNEELKVLKKEKDLLVNEFAQNQTHLVNKDEFVEIQKQLDETNLSKQMMEQQIEYLQTDLIQTRNQLNEKIEEIDLIETNVVINFVFKFNLFVCLVLGNNTLL